MSLGSGNVVSLVAYRALRASQRPARPFLMWYPGAGFVRSDAQPNAHSVSRFPDRRWSKPVTNRTP